MLFLSYINDWFTSIHIHLNLQREMALEFYSQFVYNILKTGKIVNDCYYICHEAFVLLLRVCSTTQ